MSKQSNRILTGAAISMALYFLLSGEDAAAKNKSQGKKGSIPAGAAASYIKKYFPFAKITEQFYQVPAMVTISQGGLESGWETSDIVKNSNNHFGIKADSSWKGPTYKGYRSYPNAQASFDDHAKFLVKMPRYNKAFTTNDPVTFAKHVAAAGYSENPKYAEILLQVMKSIPGLV